jgi:hypothetical protein
MALLRAAPTAVYLKDVVVGRLIKNDQLILIQQLDCIRIVDYAIVVSAIGLRINDYLKKQLSVPPRYWTRYSSSRELHAYTA